MKVIFNYNEEKDIWCLLNYGKSSNNSTTPTKTYEELISFVGENPRKEDASKFIEKYMRDQSVNVQEYINRYQNDWETVADEYQRIAEKIFGVSLPKDVTVYLSINKRCPYNIGGNYFFVPVPAFGQRKIAMHELWHFYTWYKFGITWEEKIGKQKYNDLKEALTVLLNIECKDILPRDIYDLGYPQHKELREKIVQIWLETRDIDKLWERLT